MIPHLNETYEQSLTYHENLQKAVQSDRALPVALQLLLAVVEPRLVAQSVLSESGCWAGRGSWQLTQVFGRRAWNERLVPGEHLRMGGTGSQLGEKVAAAAVAAADAFAGNVAGGHASQHT